MCLSLLRASVTFILSHDSKNLFRSFLNTRSHLPRCQFGASVVRLIFHFFAPQAKENIVMRLCFSG